MLYTAYDPKEFALVARHAVGNEHGDFDKLLAALDRLSIDAGRAGHPRVWLLIIIETPDGPNRSQRARLAAAERRIRNIGVAFVSASAAARAIQIAIAILNAGRPGCERTIYHDVESAFVWFTSLGVDPEILRSLIREVSAPSASSA